MICSVDKKKRGKPTSRVSSPTPVVSPSGISVETTIKLLELLHGASRVDTLQGSSETSQKCDPAEWAQLLVDAQLERVISRYPKPGKQCPWTGLNRNQIYELSQKIVDGRPCIETISLKEPGSRSGARFFLVGSALRYLRHVAAEQTAASNPANK